MSIAEPHTQNDTSWRRNELIATLQLITHNPAVWIRPSVPVAHTHENIVFARITFLSDTVFARITFLADTVFARITLLADTVFARINFLGGWREETIQCK